MNRREENKKCSCWTCCLVEVHNNLCSCGYCCVTSNHELTKRSMLPRCKCIKSVYCTKCSRKLEARETKLCWKIVGLRLANCRAVAEGEQDEGRLRLQRGSGWRGARGRGQPHGAPHRRRVICRLRAGKRPSCSPFL